MPREGHDSRRSRGSRNNRRFQSTCPARGTTTGLRSTYLVCKISIHVPREGHDQYEPDTGFRHYISIHVPREGHDKNEDAAILNMYISIHVPREGHDFYQYRVRLCTRYFNPRAPRGARPLTMYVTDIDMDFNPRAPRGARHISNRRNVARGLFQSTCPARGTTFYQYRVRLCTRYFNPRAPRGARRIKFSFNFPQINFNPRAPRGARLSGQSCLQRRKLFQSTCPARGTT